jgi:hypothetical protein
MRKCVCESAGGEKAWSEIGFRELKCWCRCWCCDFNGREKRGRGVINGRACNLFRDAKNIACGVEWSGSMILFSIIWGLAYESIPSSSIVRARQVFSLKHAC